MTYLDHINHFWQVNENHPFQPTGIALHFYILKVANARFWKGPYRIPNAQICGALQIDKKTLQRARNALKQAAVIDFANGKADHSPTEYRILSPEERQAVLTGGEIPPVETTGGKSPPITPPDTPPVAPPVGGTIGGKDEEDQRYSAEARAIHGVPATLRAATALCQTQAVPAEFIEQAWNQAQARDGLDGNGQPIRRWSFFIAQRWQRNQAEMEQKRVIAATKINGAHGHAKPERPKKSLYDTLPKS